MLRIEKYGEEFEAELIDKWDIGNAVNPRKALTSEERLQFLENAWKPPQDFQFPYQEKIRRGKPQKVNIY